VVDVRRQVSSILDWFDHHQIGIDEIAVDITGGTTIMSVAAFSVVSERHIDCQYVRSDFDADNKPIEGTQRGVFVTLYSPAAVTRALSANNPS
jgi:hypothetical protein